MSAILKQLKNYKYRLYPTPAQKVTLANTLNLCRELYNAALQERRDAYRMCQKSLNFYDQCKQLPEIKQVRSDLASVYSQTLQDVLHRIDKAFASFFRRIKKGETPGYPRFQGVGRYDSFAYPQLGWSLLNGRLTLSKIGTLRLKLHRQVTGKAKTCTVKREGSQWYVVFSVETEFEPLENVGPTVGIDVGLEYFANQSDGVQVENPRHFRKSEKRLAKAQRKADKLKQNPRLDPAKLKAKKVVQVIHRHIRNQRADFHHKLSHSLVSNYNLIAVENLQVRNMTRRAKPKADPDNVGEYLPNGAAAKSGLTKSINDAGWSAFISMLEYKAVNAGSRVIKVNAHHTSQICPNCGVVKPKELSERWHSCQCGLEIHRDIAAAQVILSRGLTAIGVNP